MYGEDNTSGVIPVAVSFFGAACRERVELLGGRQTFHYLPD
jgi:hypothetical protein